METVREFFKQYLIETIFSTISVITMVVAVVVLLITWRSDTQSTVVVEKADEREQSIDKVFVDLAGAVENPDLYRVKFGARLKDVLILAGGLSAEADRVFFAKNFNLAKIIIDQEKIYIPSTNDITTGLIKSNFPTTSNPNSRINSTILININSATLEQLDKLPNIGTITAEKIVRARPYQSVDDLLNKKIVGKSVYEKIKELITI